MNIHILNHQSSEGLSIVQFAADGQDAFMYVAAGRAMKEKLIEVREINEAGRVNNNTVLNSSTRQLSASPVRTTNGRPAQENHSSIRHYTPCPISVLIGAGVLRYASRRAPKAEQTKKPG